MPSHAMTAGAKRDAERPRGLWLGPVRGGELGFVRDALRGRLDLVERDVVDDPPGPDGEWKGRGPDFVILASDRPGRWSLDTAAEAARRWPLATLFGVVTSLGEGRRRSGAGVPAIEEVAWHDLPGRLECWLDDLAVGRSGALAAPATARREERLLDAVDALVGPRPAGEAAPVTVAGGPGADLEGLADLLALAGRRVVGRTAGRPRLDTETPLLVWDVVAAGPADLAWLRMLAANRPGLGVVLLDSFPRGDATVAAVRSGAGAVLPRPVSLETLEGALRRLERTGPRFREGTGLGGGAGRR